jgi:hypothetical protein
LLFVMMLVILQQKKLILELKVLQINMLVQILTELQQQLIRLEFLI